MKATPQQIFRETLKMLTDRGLSTLDGDEVQRVGAQIGAALSGLTPMQATGVLAGVLAGMLDRHGGPAWQSSTRD